MTANPGKLESHSFDNRSFNFYTTDLLTSHPECNYSIENRWEISLKILIYISSNFVHMKCFYYSKHTYNIKCANLTI